MLNKNQKIRILIGDDHSLFRSGIARLLNDDDDIFLVGEAENGEELIEKYFELKPDLVLADISMPKLSGTDAISKIKLKDKNAKALFLSMHDGEEYIYYSIKAGGLGLVNKNIMQGELLFAIKQVHSGDFYFGPGITQSHLDEIIKKYDKKEIVEIENVEVILTFREKDVLFLIGKALTSREIASKLHLSKRTIDTHRNHIMQKLNIENLPKLIRYAVQFSNKPVHR